MKYIAALFIESNASENNHCLASSDRGEQEDEISFILSFKQMRTAFVRCMNWFNARFLHINHS